ncbi:MAG TPA: vitamin K epoxide reductase family protein [Polyangiaceae bacterium]|nr:vitamin K epoxide reductase family protein [Polyangiaceae bacterium]
MTPRAPAPNRLLDDPRLPLWLIGAGLVGSLVLELVHVRAYLWPAAASYCSVGQNFDCVSVATSSTAIFFGLPWALWGVVGFVSLGAAALLRSRWLLPLSLGSALVSLALLSVELSLIGSVCLGCEVVHVITWLLAYVAWRQRARATLDLRDRSAAWWTFVVPGSLALTLIWFVPAYWGAFSYRTEPPYAQGVTPEGYPWIGSSQPRLTVHEFTDYHCPHCALGTVRSLALLERHPDLRIVRRQHPRVNCSESNCLSVRLAYCAAEQGKFWRADRWLFAHAPGRQRYEPAELARDLDLDLPRLLECRSRPELIERAQAEEKIARKARMIDTPGYQVDGKKVQAKALPGLVRERLR